PLIKKVEEILIYDQLEAIYTEVKTLLHNEKYSDLALLFKLVARVPNVTVKSKNIVEDHFCLMGIEAIRRIGKTVINVKNPKLYVETILDNHIEFFKLVRCFLNNDQHFIAALNKDISISEMLLDQYRIYCEKKKIHDVGINTLN
ncbi:unnamed protein product, partial [Rotaria sordida]